MKNFIFIAILALIAGCTACGKNEPKPIVDQKAGMNPSSVPPTREILHLKWQDFQENVVPFKNDIQYYMYNDDGHMSAGSLGLKIEQFITTVEYFITEQTANNVSFSWIHSSPDPLSYDPNDQFQVDLHFCDSTYHFYEGGANTWNDVDMYNVCMSDTLIYPM